MTAQTWEEAAAEVGAQIPWVGGYPDPLGAVENFIDLMHNNTMDHRAGFLLIADEALTVYAQQTGAERNGALAKVLTTIAEKQADYGPENILWAGVPGILLRMHDKVARIRNLERRKAAEVPGQALPSALNEPLADSWLDLVGYSIVGVMLIDGTFEYPLARDLPLPLPEPMVEVGGQMMTQSQWAAAQEALTGTPGEVANPFVQAEADPDIKEAFRLFNAASHAPEGVTPSGTDDEYTIEGGGTINVYPAPDGSHTHVTFTDGEGGVLDIMASAGYVGIDTDGTVFDLRGQRMAVILSMLLGAAESGLGWRNTKVSAEVPRDEQ